MSGDDVTEGSTPQAPLPRATTAPNLARWGSLVLHVAVAVFPLSASGLMAPGWGLAVIAVGWLVGLVAVWRIGKRRPFVAILVPVATVAAWFAFMSIGEYLFGWTA